MIKYILFAALILLSSCIQRPIVKANYNFSKTLEIAITPLNSPAQHQNAGTAAAQYIATLFLKYNIPSIILNSTGPAKNNATLIIQGSILKYTPENLQNIYSENSLGKRRSIVKYNEAEVALNLIAVDAASGQIVWSNSYSYEALDIDNALYFAVRGAVLPLISLIPHN